MNVSIVQMEDHFLYLPLHFAEENNFFGHLPKGYRVKITDARPPKDERALAQLMDPANDIHFAVCDPTEIVTANHFPDREPCVLAPIVTNSAFWAIDRGTHSVTSFGDLRLYDRVISYEPGTTSFAIATRIVNLPDRHAKGKVQLVGHGAELTSLVKSEPGTVAITPNILELVELTEDEEFHIDLELGKTPEYQNVLVTGLLSRKDFVLEHHALVIGVLRGLQIAFFHCRTESEAILAYLPKRYRSTFAANALKMANASGLFPASIEVRVTEWMQAVRARTEASGGAFDENREHEAQDLFDQSIAPYMPMVRKEALNVVLEAVVVPTAQRFPYRQWLFLLVVVWGLVGAFYLLHPDGLAWQKPILTALFMLPLGAALEIAVSADRSPRLRWAHRLVWYSLSAVLIVLAFDGAPPFVQTPLKVLRGFLAAGEFGVLVACLALPSLNK